MGGVGQHHRLMYLYQTVHSLLCISAFNLEHLLRIDSDTKNEVCFVKTKAWPPCLSLWQPCQETTALMPHCVKSEGDRDVQARSGRKPRVPPSILTNKSHIKYSSMWITCPIGISPTESKQSKSSLKHLFSTVFNRYCHDFRFSVCSSNYTIHSKCEARILQ